MVYTDPFQLEKAPHDADLIVVTHSHSDHFSPDDLRKAAGPDTCFAVTAPVADWLTGEMGVNPAYISLLTPAAPDLVFECGVVLTPLAAENKNHPLGFGFGALLEMGGFSYYVAGDTDVLSDVACDVLFVPCDGLYNMLHYIWTRSPTSWRRWTTSPAWWCPITTRATWRAPTRTARALRKS